MEKLVQGDVGSQVQATITQNPDNSVFDLTNSTAVLKFRKKGETTILTTLENVANEDQKTDGIAVFAFGSGDLDVDEGEYEGEIEVTTNGAPQTVPEIIRFYVREDF